MRTYTENQLKRYLIDVELLSNSQAEEYSRQASVKKIDFEDVLLEQNVLNNEQLNLVVSDIVGVRITNLGAAEITDEMLSLIPQKTAKYHKAIVFSKQGNELSIAIADLENIDIVALVAKKTGMQAVPYLAGSDDVDNALSLYDGGAGKGIDLGGDLIGGNMDSVNMEQLFHTVLGSAFKQKASDIHIEPEQDKTRIRFRMDGILHTVLTLPKSLHEKLISHIKVLARLRTDEHFLPQDGRFLTMVDGEELALRVSVLPIYYGEKANLRLLVSRMKNSTMQELGFSNKDRIKIDKAIRATKGMIMMTGPTGSGKTTTLYSLLKKLNNDNVNISTIEDPIEYHLEGINQTQVNRKVEYIFSTGLRALLRQDPDIIMVGEIRDNETAEISMNAGLTGHLVLATLHTNTAVQAIPRLMDMGVEPFVIANTVNIIIGQRLVRKICPHCSTAYSPSSEEIATMTKLVKNEHILADIKNRCNQGDFKLYKGTGCTQCGGLGFHGRSIISEVLIIDNEVEEMIIKNVSSNDIEKQAIKEGMITMIEDGINKVLLGVTTLTEIFRVINE